MELTLREIQIESLEILKEIKSICNKYNILYFLDSGTLLGAVRHEGFIPWDDDIDIMFWRKDYEKFVEVAKKELPHHLRLILPGEKDVFFDFIGRVINSDISVSPDTKETAYYGNHINKVSVDLLVLDNANPSVCRQKGKIALLKAIYGMAMAYRFSIDYSKYSYFQKLQVFLLSTAGKLFPYKTIYHWYQKVIQMDNNKKSPVCFGGLSIPPYLGRRIPVKCYERAIQLEFEGVQLNAPIGYDEVLTITYGDYHTPPKEEDRIPKHASL